MFPKSIIPCNLVTDDIELYKILISIFTSQSLARENMQCISGDKT